MSEQHWTKTSTQGGSACSHRRSRDIPPLLSSFGSYPNALELTDGDRQRFHPVVVFRDRVAVLDLTQPPAQRVLATEDERRVLVQEEQVTVGEFAIGRYDEDRVGLYASELFEDTDHEIDGYAGRRTLHLGVDLAGPVGTPVYAFAKGTIHSAGYNAALGDYGHVVLVRHELPPVEADKHVDRQAPRVIYALYAHLDGSIAWQSGEAVSQGAVVGCMGHIQQNGGWLLPHVHFQLALQAPKSHDMPGVVRRQDRAQALVDYPDPRYVLGPIY